MLDNSHDNYDKYSKFTVFNLSEFIAEYSRCKLHIILSNVNIIIRLLHILHGEIFIKIIYCDWDIVIDRFR